jgi:murein tripeptide amidase MpaA
LLSASEIYKQVRVYSDTPQTIFTLQESGLDIDHSFREPGQWIEFAISEIHIHLLDETNINYDIIHEDLEQFYASRLGSSSRLRSDYESRDFDLGSMGGYYTFAEIEQHLDELYINYPELITEKSSLGQTLEGRDIWMVKVSDNPEADEDEPEMLYTGLHHAREPMSYMNLFYFLNWLLDNYGIDPEATGLVNSRELYFIPAVNPDGLVYNQQIAPNGGGMQRKNRRETCFSTPDGIDLNRNYSYMWGYDNSGSSPDGCNETYRGTAPFSEPETETVKNFVETHDFKIALTYHS